MVHGKGTILKALKRWSSDASDWDSVHMKLQLELAASPAINRLQ